MITFLNQSALPSTVKDSSLEVSNLCSGSFLGGVNYLNYRGSLERVSQEKPQERVISFNEVFYKYVLGEIKLRHKDSKNVISRVACFVKFIGDKSIREIETSGIYDFLKSRNISSATRNRYLSVLNMVFRVAMEEGLIEKNPIDRIKRFKDGNKDNRVFSNPESRRFAELCLQYPDRFQSLALLLAALTGARIGNIISIEKSHISKDGTRVLLPDTKNGRSLWLELSDQAQWLVAFIRRMSSGEFLFPSKRSASGHIAIPKAAWAWILKKMDDEGVLEGHAKIHSLRHLFGTRALSATGNLQLVSKALGHGDVSVTTRYTHTNTSELKAASDLVAESILDGLDLNAALSTGVGGASTQALG